MADSATTPEGPVVMDGDVIVEFNEASSRQQINSGESVKTLFGKLKKFLTDLKAVAFSGAYSDLSGVPDLTQYASKSKYGDTTIDVGRKAGTAGGIRSTAEGWNTTASGDYSHAGGLYTKALHKYEVAYGRYNESNDDTLFSVGDGTSDTDRHNAFEITTTGGKLHDKDIAVKDDIPTISELIYTIRFSEITWNISGYGKYYYTINIPATTQLISVNLGYWEGMYPDEFVQVTINDQTNIQLISNTAKETGLLAVRISYI